MILEIPESIKQEALAIFDAHKEAISSSALNGSDWDKRVANTIMTLAGVAA